MAHDDSEIFETGALQDRAASEQDVLIGLPDVEQDDEDGEADEDGETEAEGDA